MDAVIAVNADLDLDIVLRKIVAAACAVSGARYGALGVLSPRSGHVSQFVTHGLTDQQVASIGAYPQGLGVLGVLIDDPQPLRLDHLAEHAASIGFPAGHPPMDSFLGVPVRVGGRIYGNLYLTDKQGAASFDAADQELVVALAAAAGLAVQKAELFASSQRRERWLAAAAEITTAFLAETPRPQALRLLAARAREVSDADIAAILLGRSEDLVVEVVDVGQGAMLDAHHTGWLPGDTVDVRGPLASVMDGGSARLVSAAEWGAELGLAETLLAPMVSVAGVAGVLILGRRVESEAYGSDIEVATAANFAEQAALALELARGQTDRARIAVYEDRDRIARDLHDLVVQRLFAVGLSLRTMTKRTLPEDEQVRRVAQAVDDLDDTVKELRRSIFQLHQRPGEGNVRADIEGLVAAARTALGFMPTSDFAGPVETLPDRVVPHLMAVLREALSNAARHAGASRVDVSVVVISGWLELTVVDDGAGLRSATRRGGLDNMRQRAEALGGACSLRSAPGSGSDSGTTVVWRVPVGE